MPVVKLTPADRRAAVLAVLSGESMDTVARRFGVHYETVRRMVNEAKREAPEELAYWSRVAELLAPEASLPPWETFWKGGSARARG